MSYNNFTDADAAWRPHSTTKRSAWQLSSMQPVRDRHLVGFGRGRTSQGPRMRSNERFRGVIAANTAVSVEMAEYVSTIFTEVIIAPSYEPAPWMR